MYWETFGNPGAPALVFLHGGPGGGAHPANRQLFDPTRWQVVLFDQRGAGRSRPRASTVSNTTAHLIDDMERLRSLLKIERWTVFGGSWGSTLSLAYAQAHPSACASLILRGLSFFSKAEVDWFIRGMGLFHPEAHRAFLELLDPDQRADPLSGYLERLNAPDAQGQLDAARAWCAYEAACSTLAPNPALAAFVSAPEIALPMARLEAHYLSNGAFLKPGSLLAGIESVRHIPCTLVHGRHDVICPPGLSVDPFRQAWPEAEVVIVPDAGHSGNEPALLRALVTAIESHAERLWAAIDRHQDVRL